MFAPAIQQAMLTYHSTNPLLTSFVVSVWILGYFFGSLFLGPLSELYGRLAVYLVCNVLFTVFNICTAVSPSLLALVVFRFLAGTFDGCPITIGAGTFGDLIHPRSRGKIIAIWSFRPIIGPILGPIARGKCKKLHKVTGNQALRTDIDVDRKPSHVFGRGIIRPLKLLFISPTVSILSIYAGVVYGFTYLFFTTFTLVLQVQYGFGTGAIGLTYLGLGVGSMLGLGVGGYVSDKLYREKAVDGHMKPEYRIVPLIPGAFFIPAGLFCLLLMCVSTYFIDVHPRYEASATAAATAVCSSIGALVPLFGRSMYKALGLGWGNSLLGILTLEMAPLPWLFFKGRKLRLRLRHQIRIRRG
ncbi:MFS general substrate transporter [Clathrospora elynae]|uniref:MFS general substrate transporter n=1 Tax=Clathrospora elynae TaxID=706981 RepID=A0A6A5SXN7_9PLEO|nr:MFS general substrate transporter [Clathrospora elynae]